MRISIIVKCKGDIPLYPLLQWFMLKLSSASAFVVSQLVHLDYSG